MTDTTDKVMSDLTYTQARPIDKLEIKATETSMATPLTTTTTVPQKGNMIQVRIVPKFPRQRGDQARTDRS